MFVAIFSVAYDNMLNFDLDIKDNQGRTAVDLAKEWGHNNIAKLITSSKPQPIGELSIQCMTVTLFDVIKACMLCNGHGIVLGLHSIRLYYCRLQIFIDMRKFVNLATDL